MADRVWKVSSVHRVEMEVLHAAFDQIHDLFGSNGCCNKLMRLRVIIQPVKALCQPCRDMRC